MFFAALNAIHEGVGGLHPYFCIVGSKTKLQDDIGLRTMTRTGTIFVLCNNPCVFLKTYL